MDLKHLVTIVFSLVMAVGYGFGQAVVESNQQNRSTQIESQNFGYAAFLRLKRGMSVAEVEAILGRGTKTSQSEKTETFLWENADGAKITAVFEDGKLKSLNQSKLK